MSSAAAASCTTRYAARWARGQCSRNSASRSEAILPARLESRSAPAGRGPPSRADYTSRFAHEVHTRNGTQEVRGTSKGSSGVKKTSPATGGGSRETLVAALATRPDSGALGRACRRLPAVPVRYDVLGPAGLAHSLRPALGAAGSLAGLRSRQRRAPVLAPRGASSPPTAGLSSPRLGRRRSGRRSRGSMRGRAGSRAAGRCLGAGLSPGSPQTGATSR